MKKIILTAFAVAGAAIGVYAQGDVNFADDSTPGYVVIDTNGYASSSTADYVAAPNFTAALYALPGNTNSLNALTIQPNSYGYLTPAALTADGFLSVSNTLGGSANGVSFSGGNGYFLGGTMYITGTASGSDVLAVVAWTGTYATLALAIAANADIGIFAFVNPIGAGGEDPTIPNLTGWPTTGSPANIANDPSGSYGGGYPDLILSPVVAVPEPCTLAIATLGGLSLLGLRRKKA